MGISKSDKPLGSFSLRTVRKRTVIVSFTSGITSTAGMQRKVLL